MLKLSKLLDNIEIRHSIDDKLNLVGIAGETVNTIGKAELRIRLGTKIIKHDFHIVGDKLPLKSDGILGIDFLKSYEGTINISESNLTFPKFTTLPLHFPSLNLKPRSETVVKITTDTNSLGVIERAELSKGVFVGNALVSPTNLNCLVNINTNEHIVKLDLPIFKVDKLSNSLDSNNFISQDMYVIKISANNKSDRIKLILDSVSHTHLNSEERDSLFNICTEYNDIFFCNR